MTSLLTLFASLVGAWAFFKYVMLVEVRVDPDTYKTMYDYFRDHPKFILQEEFTSERRHPVLFSAFLLSRSTPWFLMSHGERLMQAGWQSKDQVTTVSCLRWNYRSLKRFLANDLRDASMATNGVPVQVLLPYSVDKIGSLRQLAPKPVADPALWGDIDSEVAEVASGSRPKTGVILHGPPGNGKTSLVKHLATKHRLPVMVFTLDPQWGNHDLLQLFANIPSRCIVLMEDFDNYFRGRECLLNNSATGGGVRFTFDVILNGLDGVYNTYEGVVFFMTVNNVDHVDDALKNRPSRFKFVRKFDNPGPELRERMLGDWSVAAVGLNLDQTFRLAEYKSAGFQLGKALSLMSKELRPAIEGRAHEIYRHRISNGRTGTPDEDWSLAELEFRPNG